MIFIKFNYFPFTKPSLGYSQLKIYSNFIITDLHWIVYDKLEEMFDLSLSSG